MGNITPITLPGLQKSFRFSVDLPGFPREIIAGFTKPAVHFEAAEAQKFYVGPLTVKYGQVTLRVAATEDEANPVEVWWKEHVRCIQGEVSSESLKRDLVFTEYRKDNTPRRVTTFHGCTVADIYQDDFDSDNGESVYYTLVLDFDAAR